MVWRADRKNLTEEEKYSTEFVKILSSVAWDYGFNVMNVPPDHPYDWNGEGTMVFVYWKEHRFEVHGCPEKLEEPFAMDLSNAIEDWKSEHEYC